MKNEIIDKLKEAGYITVTDDSQGIADKVGIGGDSSSSGGESGKFVAITKLDDYSLQITIKTIVRDDTIKVYEINEPNKFPTGFSAGDDMIRLRNIRNINEISAVNVIDIKYRGFIAWDYATKTQIFLVYLFKDISLNKYYIASFEYIEPLIINIPVRTDHLYEKI